MKLQVLGDHYYIGYYFTQNTITYIYVILQIYYQINVVNGGNFFFVIISWMKIET